MAGPWEAFQQQGPWTQFQQEIEQPPLSAAITDIPSEIVNAVQENLDTIKTGVTNKAEQGVIGGQLATGRAMLALPGLLAAPITGAARSLLGHPLAQAEHAIGSVINPQIAAQDNPQEMYQTAKSNVDTALAGLAPRGASPVGVRTAPSPTPSGEAIKSTAKAGFDAAKSSGVTVPAQDVANLATQARTSLESAGFRDYLAPKTFSALAELEKPPQGAVASVADLHGIRRVLGKAAASPDATERSAAAQVMGEIDRLLATVSPELKTAVGNYAAAKRSDLVRGKLENADLNAASAHSGTNIDNSIRQQIRTILTNPRLRRGFSKEELVQMEKIVKGTSAGNVIRTVGNMLGGGGGLGAVVSGAAGYGAAGPAGVAAPAIGYALKKVGNALTARQVAKLDEMIRARSPLARSLPPQIAPVPGPLPAMLGGLLPRPLLPYLPMQVPAYADNDKRR
jgi:hypothetical protein